MIEYIVAAMVAGHVEVGPGVCRTDWMVLDSNARWTHVQNTTKCGEEIDVD
jgi:hypothetical protein